MKLPILLEMTKEDGETKILTEDQLPVEVRVFVRSQSDRLHREGWDEVNFALVKGRGFRLTVRKYSGEQNEEFWWLK